MTKNKTVISQILIIQTASIGDVILATPLIEKLAHDFPGAAIDFMLRKGIEGILVNNPHIRNVLIWNKSENKYGNLFSIIRKVRHTRYDLVVVVQRFFTAGLVAAFSGAGIITGFEKNPLSWFFDFRITHEISSDPAKSQHETQRNLKLLEPLKGSTQTYSTRVYLAPSDDENMLPYKSHPFLCVAPASLWFTKQFPVEKWTEFISLIYPGIRVYFIGAKGDTELADRIISQSGNQNSQNLCGKLSFTESASLMRDALMNFVNDSAPLHLASAVDAPVTAIFCSTVPAFGFGPLSSRSKIIETEKSLRCRPCGLHGFKSCPEKHFDCARSIAVERLLQLIPLNI